MTILEQGLEIGTLLQGAAGERGTRGERERRATLRRPAPGGWRSLYRPDPSKEVERRKGIVSHASDHSRIDCEGQSNKEIARTLGVAPETVKSHVKNISSSLLLTSELMRRARANARTR